MHAPAKLPAGTEQEFQDLLALFPAANAFETAYIARTRTRGWQTFQHLPMGTGNERLLDVGGMQAIFGPAYMQIWKYREVHLIDMDVPAGGVIKRTMRDGRELSFPVKRFNVELEPWPYPDGFFNTVVCTEVLEHMVFDPVFVMNEISRVLAPDGRALITIPNAASDSILTYLVNDMQPGYLRNYISDALKSGKRDVETVYNLGHFHEYTGTELRCLARATGFDVEYLTGISPHPFLLDSLRFKLLCTFVHALFPNAKRVRYDHLLALLQKRSYTPLHELPDRYPFPLYKPLSTNAQV
jgi:SAM-dependent methyltransferase